MLDIKTRRLDAIKDECADFHPLLQKLLPKLRNVKNVDHTHGTNEMGADFVVTMEDPTFSTEHYVAVIAKVGNIDQGAVDGFERQIKECEIVRLSADSRKQVNITQVWIATNGTISPNAQKKFHHLFAHKSLQFIHRPKLIAFIDEYLPSYWTDVDLEIADYLNRTREKNEELDRNVSLLQIGNTPFYIEQDLIETEPERYDSKGRKERTKEKKVSIQQELKKGQLMLVEAGAGMGKSKLLRNLISYYANPAIYLEEKVVPVYTSYAAFAGKHGGSIDTVVKAALGSNTISALVEETRILVLIDGIDEKNDSPESLQAAFDKIQEETKANNSYAVVATTRYLSVPQEAELSRKNIRLLEIRELSLTRIIEFLGKLCTHSNLPGRIVEDLKKSPLFKDLPKSPIAAILLGRLLREHQRDLPSNMTELYAQYVEIILGRWDIEKGLQTQREYEALSSILTNIATYFVENELGYLSIDEAKEFFQRYLENRNLGITVDALFQKMVERCEIVFLDPDRNRLAFKHRTFAEFLYAKQQVKGGTVHVSHKALEPYWMNTFFFMAGLLKDCPDFINEYLALKPQNEFQQWMKISNAGSVMLAGFATEYRHIEAGIYKIYEEAAKLYKAALDGQTELEMCKYNRMSALEFLGFCQYLLKSNYAFKFFEKAIESAAYALESDSSTEDYRPYALFFLFTTSISLENTEAADLVIKALGINIPLAVRLGLHIEGRTVKEKSKLLKKLDHHTMDIIRLNKRSNHQANILFQIPLVKADPKPIRRGQVAKS